jgi:AhpD family alkylhydroperoxidase
MSQRMNYNAVSPAGMKALGAVYRYVRQSGLPARLVDLVYLRVSQINGCAYCIDAHSRDLLKAGLPVEHLALVAVQRPAASLTSAKKQRSRGRKSSPASATGAFQTARMRRPRRHSTRSSLPT